MQKNDFLHLCKPKIYTKLSFCSHRFPVSTTTKIITCSFSFNQVLAASSPSTNRPKSKSGYLAIVSLKHGRLVRIRSQYSLFRRSPTRQNLPPATFDASEQLLFGSFCRSKKNVKLSFWVLFVQTKSTYIVPWEIFRKKKISLRASFRAIRKSTAPQPPLSGRQTHASREHR